MPIIKQVNYQTVMKKIILFLNTFFLLNACTPNNPEKVLTWQEEYQQISGIKLPKDYKVIYTTPLNSDDLVKKTIIELNEKDCKDFFKNKGFTAIEDSVSPTLFNSRLIDSVYRLIPERARFIHRYGKLYSDPTYFKYDTKKNANWVYLVDTGNCRLYCLISKADLNCYVK